jgi:hypothetical protein
MPAANMPPTAKKIVIEIRYRIAMRLCPWSGATRPGRRARRDSCDSLAEDGCHKKTRYYLYASAGAAGFSVLILGDQLHQVLFADHSPGTPA